jgi:hypothetical protein
MKIVIDNTMDWYRDSQDIAFFAYVMDLAPEQVDEMFRLAVTL